MVDLVLHLGGYSQYSHYSSLFAMWDPSRGIKKVVSVKPGASAAREQLKDEIVAYGNGFLGTWRHMASRCTSGLDSGQCRLERITIRAHDDGCMFISSHHVRKKS